MNTLLAQAKAAADKLADQTDESGGGNFEYEPPAAGMTMARLVSYIEIGPQPQPDFAGKPKAPSPECIIEFQLLGKKHAKEIEVDVEGQKVKKTIYPIIRLGRGPGSPVGKAVKNGMNMPGGSKSNHFKLMSAMRYGREDMTNMAFMLGEAFKIEVIHNTQEKEVNGKKTTVTYANIRTKEGVWTVSSPMVQKIDEETGEPDGPPRPIKCSEPTVPLRMLLWDAPSIEQWESIFIDGTFKKKIGDTEVDVSKNWIQEQCFNSTAFEGSALQTMLMQEGGDLPQTDLGDELDSTPEAAPEDLDGDLAPDVPEEVDLDTSGAETGASAEDDPLAGLEFDDEIPF